MLWCQTEREVLTEEPSQANSDNFIDEQLETDRERKQTVDGEVVSRDLRDQFSNAMLGKDIFLNPDPLIREKGMRILDRMIDTDAEVKNAYLLKKFVRLSQKWSIDPAINNNEFAEMLSDFIKWNFKCFLNTTIESFLLKIWDASRQGFKVAELVWQIIPEGRWQGLIGLKDIIVRNSRNYSFALEEDGRIKPRGIVEGLNSSGIGFEPERRLPTRKFVVYSWLPLDDDGVSKYGHSDFRATYRYYYGNLTTHKNKLRKTETFSRPPLIIKFPRGAYSKAQRIAITKNLSGIYGRVVTTTFDDVEHSVVETSRQDDGSDRLLEYQGDQISRSLLLGPVLQGSKQRGVSVKDAQQETFIYVLDWMGQETSSIIMGKQIIERMINLNWKTDLYPIFRMPSMSKDRNKESEFIKNLVESAVVDPSEPWIRELLEIPTQRIDDRLDALDRENEDIEITDFSESEMPVFVLRGGALARIPDDALIDKDEEPGYWMLQERDNGQTEIYPKPFDNKLILERVANNFVKKRPDIKFRIAKKFGSTMGFPVFQVVKQIVNTNPSGPVLFSEKDYVGDRINFQQIDIRTREFESLSRNPVISGYQGLFDNFFVFVENEGLSDARDKINTDFDFDLNFAEDEFRKSALAFFSLGAIDLFSEIGIQPVPAGVSSDSILQRFGINESDLVRFEVTPVELASLPFNANEWDFVANEIERSIEFALSMQRNKVGSMFSILLGNAVQSGLNQDELKEAARQFFQDFDDAEFGHSVDVSLRNVGNQFYNLGRLNAGRNTPQVRSFMYSSRLDGSTTEFCDRFKNKVYEKNSNIWNGLLPPNHFNCRAILLPVMQDDPINDDTELPNIQPQKGFGIIPRDARRG